eukprot:gene5597-6286_t
MSWFSEWQYLAPISAFVTLLNIAAIIVICNTRKDRRKSTTFLMISLLISDASFGAVLMPVRIVEIWMTYHGVFPYLYAYFIFVSAFNSFCLALDRYASIVKPLWRRRIDDSIVTKGLIVTWSVPLVLSLLPLSWTYSMGYDSNATTVYGNVLVGILMLIVACIVIFQLLLVHGLYRYWLSLRRTNMLRSFRGQVQVNDFKVKRNSSLLCSCLIISTVITWLPTIVLNFIDLVLLSKVSLFALMVNSLFDPLLVILCNSKKVLRAFRRKFRLRKLRFTTFDSRLSTIDVDIELKMEVTVLRIDDEDFLAKFCISFSWDYPDNWALSDVLSAVFHVVDDRDERSQDQLVCSGVQSSGCGVILTQPHPDTDIVPCEMTFTAHPISSEFCVTKIFVVSEAKNLELYVDNMYEKTAPGLMLTLKKGKNAALFEAEFDLSMHIQGSNKVLIKFVSLPDKDQVRLQTVVIKVTKCSPNQIQPPPSAMGMSGTSVEMNGVRQMIESMGMSIPSGGANLMAQIENQQKQLQALQLQQLLSIGSAQGAIPLNLPQALLQCQQSLNQQRQPKSKEPVSEAANAVPKFEESVLANAILNTEKFKRETQQAMEEEQRRAQLNYLKQLLGGGQDEMLSSRPASNLSSNLNYRDSMSEELAQERHLTQMMTRLMNENHSQSTIEPETFADHGNRRNPLARSKVRTSQRIGGSKRGAMLSPLQTPRPASFSFSDASDRDYQRHLNETEEMKHLPHQLLTNSKRCQDCGCPGCLSVYNSITTNVYAMEERLIGRIDLKMQELSRQMETKFEALHDALFSRQQQVITQLVEGFPHSPAGKKVGKDTVMYRSDEA